LEKDEKKVFIEMFEILRRVDVLVNKILFMDAFVRWVVTFFKKKLFMGI